MRMYSHVHLAKKVRETMALFVLLFVVVLIVGIGAPRAFVTNAASGPTIFNYQGRVLNANGVPVTSATLDIVFELHTDPALDTCVWSNSSATCASSTAQTVDLTNGLFSEELGNVGDGYASLAGIFEANGTLYLDVTIEGETLSPRKRVLSAPYAMNAGSLNGLDSDAFVSATGDSVTGQFTFTQSAGDTAVIIDQNADTGTALGETDGGALHIANTGNNHSALTLYTNNGATAGAPLMDLWVNNALFDQDAFRLTNKGVAVGLHIVQDTIDSPGAEAIGNQALVIDVNEASGTDDVFIIRADADGTPATQFRFQNDGNAFAEGAFTGGGADFAEYFDSIDGALGDYDLVCSSSRANTVERCTDEHDAIVGVISTNPAFIANSNGADRHADDGRPLVGLIGQIETRVVGEGGPIAVGDPIGVSSIAGAGAKAVRAGSIVGFALEAFDGEQGTILVSVNPQWHAGAGLPTGEMTFGRSIVLSPAVERDFVSDSPKLTLYASNQGEPDGFDMVTRIKDGGIVLSWERLGETLMKLNQTGDLHIAGAIVISALENGNGLSLESWYQGDITEYLTTNGKGFASSGGDYAELYRAEGGVTIGDVVAFGETEGTVKRASAGDDLYRIAGVVSEASGFIVGVQDDEGVAVALSGSVIANVSGEGGSIEVGDALTLSTIAGYARKADGDGSIVGYALEDFSGERGVMKISVRPTYGLVRPETTTLSVAEDLDLGGGRLLGVRSLSGIGGTWAISERGDFYTRGKIGQYVETDNGSRELAYVSLTREQTVQMTGSVELQGGEAYVQFLEIDPQFASMISSGRTYQVFLTPNGSVNQLYIHEKSKEGFRIKEQNGNATAMIDWLIIAYPYNPLEEESNSVAIDQIVESEEGVTEPEQEMLDESNVIVENETTGVTTESPTNESVVVEQELPTDQTVEITSDTEANVGTEEQITEEL